MTELKKVWNVEAQDMIYSNVQNVVFINNGIRFDKFTNDGKTRRGVTIQGPFTAYEEVSLSCGHKLESYYEEDGGNAGCFAYCRECDPERKIP